MDGKKVPLFPCRTRQWTLGKRVGGTEQLPSVHYQHLVCAAGDAAWQ